MPAVWKVVSLATGISIAAFIPLVPEGFDWHRVSGQIAGLISAVAFLIYIKAILRADKATRTKPNRVTWFVWSIIGWLILWSYQEVGADKTIWLVIVYAVSPTIIFFLALVKGEGGWTVEDLAALVVSVIGLGLWWFSQSALSGLIFFLVADLAAAVPTIKKSYRDPEHEDRVAWLTTAIADIFHLLAVDRLELGIILHPLYMLVLGWVIVYPLWRPVLRPSSRKDSKI